MGKSKQENKIKLLGDKHHTSLETRDGFSAQTKAKNLNLIRFKRKK